jgi:hypothetical protein
VAYHHTGVVINDCTKNGLNGALGSANPWPVHEITDPQVVYVVDLIGLSHICPSFYGQPSLLFYRPKKGVVVNRRISKHLLIPKIFIQLLNGPVGIGLTFDLNGFEDLIVKPSRSTSIGTYLWLEGVESVLAIFP